MSPLLNFVVGLSFDGKSIWVSFLVWVSSPPSDAICMKSDDQRLHFRDGEESPFRGKCCSLELAAVNIQVSVTDDVVLAAGSQRCLLPCSALLLVP